MEGEVISDKHKSSESAIIQVNSGCSVGRYWLLAGAHDKIEKSRAQFAFARIRHGSFGQRLQKYDRLVFICVFSYIG